MNGEDADGLTVTEDSIQKKKKKNYKKNRRNRERSILKNKLHLKEIQIVKILRSVSCSKEKGKEKKKNYQTFARKIKTISYTS